MRYETPHLRNRGSPIGLDGFPAVHTVSGFGTTQSANVPRAHRTGNWRRYGESRTTPLKHWAPDRNPGTRVPRPVVIVHLALGPSRIELAGRAFRLSFLTFVQFFVATDRTPGSFRAAKAANERCPASG